MGSGERPGCADDEQHGADDARAARTATALRPARSLGTGASRGLLAESML
ncbi:hypothetical protein [Georgenia sp. SUBG003]